MFNAEQLQEKWAPVLDHEGLDPIKDSHRRATTAILLENQEKELNEERSFLAEAVPTNSTASGANPGLGAATTGAMQGFDPVLISLIRRSMPNLVAYDLAECLTWSHMTLLVFNR